MTHGDTTTYPQIGRLVGFITPDQLLVTAEKILTIQRDYGNRSVRKNARFKYTIDKYGLEWFKEELHKRLGFELAPLKPYQFERTGDQFGWIKGEDGNWHYTLFIQNGRIRDFEDYQLMTGLREIAKVHTGLFRLTPNQNLLIANVTPQKKRKINALIEQYKLTDGSALFRTVVIRLLVCLYQRVV